jgi:hypothetical protein
VFTGRWPFAIRSANSSVSRETIFPSDWLPSGMFHVKHDPRPEENEENAVERGVTNHISKK